MKRILTGSRTTGRPHLGNYLAAYKPLVDYSSSANHLYFFLADFHALNEGYDAKTIRQNSLEMTATLLSLGFDYNKNLLFSQSAVPEVTELSWILSCVTPFGMLQRGTTYKDAVAKGTEVNMGVFNYPILMAADILLYDADLVPVGKDQKQHLEMARDIAQRFNHKYGEVLKVPEPIISEDVGLVPGIDGEKMSKSKDNTISLFASDKQWKKQIMAIVTGSETLEEKKDPENCNVFQIYKLLSTKKQQDELAEKYRAGNFGYGHAKIELLELMKEQFTEARDKFDDYMSRPNDLIDIILDGSKKARAQAVERLTAVQDACGLIGRSK